MELYSPKQWLLIDLAVQMGFEKSLYSERLIEGRKIQQQLIQGADIGTLAKKAKSPHMFAACAIAVTDVMAGKKSGYPVSLDSSNSGPQWLSTLWRCETGMKTTGVLNVGLVPDAYTVFLKVMEDLGVTTLTREKVKLGAMPYNYNGVYKAMATFGDNFPAFEQAYATALPAVSFNMQALEKAWGSKRTHHTFIMPDGMVVRVPTINTIDLKCNYGNNEYKYSFKRLGTKRRGAKKTLGIAAHIAHGYDAFVLRELTARINYNPKEVKRIIELLETKPQVHGPIREREALRVNLYARAQVKYDTPSVGIYTHLNPLNYQMLSTDTQDMLLHLLYDMLDYPSVQLKVVFDDFGVLPNHIQHLRRVYNQLLREAYLGNWIVPTVRGFTGVDHTEIRGPVNMNTADKILEADYPIT
jgi:hypothetical protein